MTGETLITFPCRWVIWDGANEDELRSVAGDRIVEFRDGTPWWRSSDGTLRPMPPGWAAYLPDGQDRAVICGPEAWAGMGGPQAAGNAPVRS